MSLSDFELTDEKGIDIFIKDDVKEAIKELKLRCGKGTCDIIDEIFGEDLI